MCTDVAAYCAQRVAYHDLSTFEVLSGVKTLVEVGAIIPHRFEGATRTQTALVNVGGVHSPFSDEAPAYTRVVVPAVVAALQSAEYEVRVIGNVDAFTASMLPDDVPAGPVPHDEVGRLLAESAVLFTSPGLTTMLEAGAAQIPTALLPPQNVSQVLNADEVTRSQDAHPARIDWPEHVVHAATVRELAKRSEEDALRFIYAAIEAIEPNPGFATWLRDECACRLPASASWLRDYSDNVGGEGAAQVAQVVREVAARSLV